MENAARLYNCARCHRQVMICSGCDRGNIYCHEGCAQAARRVSLQAAGWRYQQTRHGRHKHAERQRRYRAARQKVTHQGSPDPSPHDPLPPVPKRPDGRRDVDGAPMMAPMRCHFCGRECGPFLRIGPLHRATAAAALGTVTRQGPPGARAQPP